MIIYFHNHYHHDNMQWSSLSFIDDHHNNHYQPSSSPGECSEPWVSAYDVGLGCLLMVIITTIIIIINTIIIIMISRSKPAFGRLGHGGSSGGKSVSLFLTDAWVRVETHLSSSRISWKSGRLCWVLKDVKKLGDQLNRFLDKQQQIFLMI